MSKSSRGSSRCGRSYRAKVFTNAVSTPPAVKMSSSSSRYAAWSCSLRVYSPVRRTGLPSSPHATIVSPTATLGRRATVRGAPEFGNRDGPSLPDGGTNTVAEPVGDLGRPVPGVGRDDVKGRPVDAVERQRGVADLPAEPCPDRLDGLAE